MVKTKLTTRIPSAAIILGERAEIRPISFISLSDIICNEMDHRKSARRGSKSRIISIPSGRLKANGALSAFVLTVTSLFIVLIMGYTLIPVENAVLAS
jgi:hypothetical protein